MKKGILFIALSALMVSCTNNSKEAAKEFCNCHSEFATNLYEGDGTENVPADDMTSAEIDVIITKTMKCHKAWKKKYNGKVDIDDLKEEVKKQDKEVYDFAIEKKMFE